MFGPCFTSGGAGLTPCRDLFAGLVPQTSEYTKRITRDGTGGATAKQQFIFSDNPQGSLSLYIPAKIGRVGSGLLTRFSDGPVWTAADTPTFAGQGGWVSKNFGESWTQIPSLTLSYTRTPIWQGGTSWFLYNGATNADTAWTNDNWTTFTIGTSGIGTVSSSAMTVDVKTGNICLAWQSVANARVSKNGGRTFDNADLPSSLVWHNCSYLDGTLVLGPSAGTDVALSDSHGKVWTIGKRPSATDQYLYSPSVVNGVWWWPCYTAGIGALFSKDRGKTWVQLRTPITNMYPNMRWIQILAYKGGALALLENTTTTLPGMVLWSADGFSDWTPLKLPSVFPGVFYSGTAYHPGRGLYIQGHSGTTGITVFTPFLLRGL